MPQYQAQRQSLYGVGSPAFIRPQIDVGGAIQDLAGAGNSFIHQAFLRRQAENEMQLRRGEFQLQQQREARESAAQQQELGFRSRQLGIAEQGNNIRAAMAGYTPAHTEVTAEPPPPAAAPPAPSEEAQISGLPAQGGNTPLTRPANLGPVTKLDFNDVPASYDPTRSVQYQRTIGAINARAAARAPRMVTKVDAKGNYFTVNEDTGETHDLVDEGGSPMKAPPRAAPRAAPRGEPQDVSSTRKDLADTNRQQVRAENAVKALKSEQRQIQHDNPRVAKPLLAQRTAADSAAAQRFQEIAPQIDAAQQRSALLTQRADSITGVLDQKRSAPPAAPASGAPVTSAPSPAAKPKGRGAAASASAIDPDSITDEELVAAHAAGARTTDAVKTYVSTLRTTKKKP